MHPRTSWFLFWVRPLAQVRRSIQRRREWEQSVTKSLNALTAAQLEVVRGTTVLADVSNLQLRRSRPGPFAMLFAVAFLAAASGAVWYGIVQNSHASDYQQSAAFWRDQEQTENASVDQDLAPLIVGASDGNLLATPGKAKLVGAVVKDIGGALNKSEDDEDKALQFDAKGSSASSNSTWGLAFGSAYLGAIVGWFLTQILLSGGKLRLVDSPS